MKLARENQTGHLSNLTIGKSGLLHYVEPPRIEKILLLTPVNLRDDYQMLSGFHQFLIIKINP